MARWPLVVAMSGIMPLGGAAAQDPGVGDKAFAILRAGLAAPDADDFWPAMHAAEGLTLAGAAAEVRRALEPRLAAEEDPRRRCGLARELVRAGDRSQVAVLAGILAGDDVRGHVHAAESLFKVGAVGDAAALARAFDQRDNLQLRLMAAAALTRAGSPEPLTAIRAALRGDDPDGVMLAGWILGQIGDASDIELVRRRVAGAPTPLARAFLEHALAELGDPQGRDALGRNLDSADAGIRAAAAASAGPARATAAVPRLVRMLDDEAADARIRAAGAILLLTRGAGGARPPAAAGP